MTSEFVRKMITAKKMEYEALRELLPDKVKDNMDEISTCLKEMLIECVKEAYFSPEHAEKKQEDIKRDCAPNDSKVQKVTIE